MVNKVLRKNNQKLARSLNEEKINNNKLKNENHQMRKKIVFLKNRLEKIRSFTPILKNLVDAIDKRRDEENKENNSHIINVGKSTFAMKHMRVSLKRLGQRSPTIFLRKKIKNEIDVTMKQHDKHEAMGKFLILLFDFYLLTNNLLVCSIFFFF